MKPASIDPPVGAAIDNHVEQLDALARRIGNLVESARGDQRVEEVAPEDRELFIQLCENEAPPDQ